MEGIGCNKAALHSSNEKLASFLCNGASRWPAQAHCHLHPMLCTCVVRLSYKHTYSKLLSEEKDWHTLKLCQINSIRYSCWYNMVHDYSISQTYVLTTCVWLSSKDGQQPVGTMVASEQATGLLLALHCLRFTFIRTMHTPPKCDTQCALTRTWLNIYYDCLTLQQPHSAQYNTALLLLGLSHETPQYAQGA